jgi:endonuclease/exonuclease/phosphatase family metal-dependent hydrolase
MLDNMKLSKLNSVFLFAVFAFSGSAETLRFMTFNVRYPAPNDGQNRWEARRDLFVETIRSKDPDLFGTQELFETQGQYIVEKLPEYKWFGLSRRGNHEDEHMGVFYKASRLAVVESGNFWLSETPEKPGSMSWNVTLPRMVTWALFEIRSTGRKFYYYNTHFPHRAEDEEARMHCAQVILERAAKLPKDVPFILAGDFNAPAGGEVYKSFAGDLKEAWATAVHRFGPEGTFNGFRGTGTGPRIDWIFYRGFSNVLQAETVSLNENGRYPSDHFPVFAVFEVD